MYKEMYTITEIKIIIFHNCNAHRRSTTRLTKRTIAKKLVASI